MKSGRYRVPVDEAGVVARLESGGGSSSVGLSQQSPIVSGQPISYSLLAPPSTSQVHQHRRNKLSYKIRYNTMVVVGQTYRRKLSCQLYPKVISLTLHLQLQNSK